MSNFENTDKCNCVDCKDKSCAATVLSLKQLELLNNNSKEIDLKKGEIILHSGALNSHIVYLKSGYVKEYLIGNNNRSRILQVIKKHSYLGLHSLFGDKVNHYSYSALVDLKICYIDIDIFKRLVKESGEFAYELLKYTCKESLLINYHFLKHSQKNTAGRFADVLIYLSEQIFESPSFEMHLSRQELSELIGISRENTARVITQFKSDGLIDATEKKIKILKMDLIKKISKNG
jgi:CRP-like cAMP-binding protein